MHFAIAFLKMDKLLIISPHPDDLEISCSILTLLVISNGWEVRQLIITDGRYSSINESLFGTIELIEKRKQEALLSAETLGIEETKFLNIEDNCIKLNRNVIKENIENEIKEFLPNCIVFPSRLDYHPDHRALGSICGEIVKSYEDIDVLTYVFWNNKDLKFDIKISSPESSDKKILAMEIHESQPVVKYITSIRNRGELYEEYFNLFKNRKIMSRELEDLLKKGSKNEI